jgi:Domain of unknown function (DUF6895)
MGGRETRWARDDIERRLCRAIDFARQAVVRLASAGYTDSEEPANNVRPEKLISETAVLLYAAAAAGRLGQVGVLVDEVAQLLIPHARSPRMLLGVCLEPALALDYAEAHICLTRLGYRDAGFDQLLRQSIDSQAAPGRERPPHRMLEQQWLREIWNDSGSGRPARADRAAVKTILNNSMDLLCGSRLDSYAFTHALMYLTGFTIKPRPLPRPRSVILGEAEAVLARSLDTEDYDLSGELLMAWPLTGKSWSTAAAFGFGVLARVEDNAGVLPAPSTRRDRLDKLEGNRRASYFLATAYHTAYVMGLLCAFALQPGRRPPATPATRTAADGSSDTILRFLDADGRRPDWRHEFDRLPMAQRDALAGFLLNIALHRKIGKRDFGAVHELLKTGYALGLADTPAASQAAEMLERLATFHRVKFFSKPSQQES